MVAVAGSPWGPRGGRHHPCSPRGQDQAWLGLEMFAGGLLSLIMPPEPCWAGGGLATLSWLSQCPCPHDGKSGVCRWGGTVGPRQGPRIPQGPQPALLAPCPAGTLSPTRASGVPSPSPRPVQGTGHPKRGRVPSPTQGHPDPTCSTGWGRGVPPHHSHGDLTGACI